MKFKLKKTITYRPSLGTYFQYGGNQFKIIRRSTRGTYYFAWVDQRKIVTSNMEDPGMPEDALAKAIVDGRYQILDEWMVNAQLVEFTLF